MNAVIAAPLGIAAALVTSAADATIQAQPVPEPEPLVPPAAELAADLLTSEPPAPDLLEPPPPAAAAPEAADPVKICDEKCKFIELTRTVLPNTPVADLVSVALEPDKHALTIPNDEGQPALTIKLDPTKVARGKGLVATAKF